MWNLHPFKVIYTPMSFITQSLNNAKITIISGTFHWFFMLEIKGQKCLQRAIAIGLIALKWWKNVSFLANFKTAQEKQILRALVIIYSQRYTINLWVAAIWPLPLIFMGPQVLCSLQSKLDRIQPHFRRSLPYSVIKKTQSYLFLFAGENSKACWSQVLQTWKNIRMINFSRHFESYHVHMFLNNLAP